VYIIELQRRKNQYVQWLVVNQVHLQGVSCNLFPL